MIVGIIGIAGAAVSGILSLFGRKKPKPMDVRRVDIPVSVHNSMYDPATGNGYTGASGTTTYDNMRGPWYSSLPASRVFYIGAGIAALTIGSATLSLNKPGSDSVAIQASQMPGVHSLLQSISKDQLPEDLTGHVFFQTSHLGSSSDDNPGITAVWVTKDNEGRYSVNKTVLNANGVVVGSDPNNYTAAFYVADDGSIQPNLKFAHILDAQSAMLTASGSKLSVENQVAALRQAAAQGHEVALK